MRALITLMLLLASSYCFSQNVKDFFGEALLYTIHVADSNHLAARKVLKDGEYEFDLTNSDRRHNIYSSTKETPDGRIKHLIMDKRNNRVGLFVMGDWNFNKRMKSLFENTSIIAQKEGFFMISREGFEQKLEFGEFVWIYYPELAPGTNWSRRIPQELKSD